MGFIDRNSELTWHTPTIGSIGINRKPNILGLYYINSENPTPINYKQKKNYQFLTVVRGDNPIGSSIHIRLSSPFKSSVATITDNTINSSNGIIFYTYANPLSSESSTNIVQYGADTSFVGNNVILSSSFNEVDFLINGFREFKYLGNNPPLQPNGWVYEQIDGLASYTWYNTIGAKQPIYSTFGSGLTNTTLNTNYIAKLIDYDIFSIELDFIKVDGGINDGVNMYLVREDQLKNGINSWGSIVRLTKDGQVVDFRDSGHYESIGLRGTNLDGTKNYIVFTTTTSSVNIEVSLSNINVYGGYNIVNNTQIIPNTLEASSTLTKLDFDTKIIDSSYRFTSLDDNGITFNLSSRIGNGFFKSGIWENGVWNNGWRDDVNSRDFDDVYSSVLYSYDVSWKVRIMGSTSSCDHFKIGDKVSIGNIVGVDINENRKLLRDYYTIVDKGVDTNRKGSRITGYTNWIEINLDTTFPYRRIEKDSPNHKIKITKNVWLSGAFFNGYFSGVWNNGLFKGYPKITEMFNTHWIDGFFNGGHFNARYPISRFIDIVPTLNCVQENITLVFNSGHGLLPGDYIFIDKDKIFVNNVPTLFNESYNGLVKVLSVDGNNVIVDKKYGITVTGAKEGGTVTRYTSSGVIQNFKFYDTNRSKMKSGDTQISSSVFNFNSWIDTNYDDSRSVTLSRDFRLYEPLTGMPINRNNLYGYPTYDVLSSVSRFRNSFDLDYKIYKLGTKYKLYNDFIGEGSEFNEPFNELDFKPFFDSGWTYSTASENNIELKRTETIISVNDVVAESYIESGVTGEELWVSANSSGMILNNTGVSVNRSRYSVVELDVITHSVTSYDYIYDNPDIHTIESITSSDLFSESNITSTEIISTYSVVDTLGILDVDDIVVNIEMLGTLSKVIINLKAPNGNVINLKKYGGGIGGRLANTNFSLKDTFPAFSDTTSPYNLNNVTNFAYTGTFLMDREINQGLNIYSSNVNTLSGLTSGSIYGNWTLYIKYDTLVQTPIDLTDWSINIKYRKVIAINTEPNSIFPIIHFSNLNYDVSTQLSGNGVIQTYKKMSYLPVSSNVNHLLTKNSFRLDSIEKTSPERHGGFGSNQSTKKYEYFYNKTDLMMSISGNGDFGSSASMVVLDNIKMYEVDMIPFFKYFEDNNIYKGIQIPYEGIAPNIDYLNTDFVFVDNISIGLDTIDSGLFDNTTFVCTPPIVIVSQDKVTVTTDDVTSIIYDEGTFKYNVAIGGSVVIEGNLQLNRIGIRLGTSSQLSDNVNDVIIELNNTTTIGSTITKLEPNTTYYVKAYVFIIGELVTRDGEVKSFTTPPIGPDYDILDYSNNDYSTT